MLVPRLRDSDVDPRADRAPSVLWRWGLWAYAGVAVAAFVLSLYTPTPVDRLLRAIAGVLFLVGGAHQLRVVDYKIATRRPYSTFGPDSYPLQRQTARSAMVLGAVFIASALVEM